MPGAEQAVIHVLLTVPDLGGTFVFAISGAAAAVKHRLDIFGVMALAFAAGCHCQLA
ncbi:MAG: TRIC cation channel family protein, partial [Gammaproteobacteria bacterium]|nr:TRIC cation channel family protein [Gammaproteobacteria bacterium]